MNKCFNCGKPGHRAFQCKEEKIKKELSNIEPKFDLEYYPLTLSETESKCSDAFLYHVFYKGKCLKALIDTGAACSFVRYFDGLNFDSKDKINVVLADGSGMSVIGACFLDVESGGKSKFYVFKNLLYDAIIGRDNFDTNFLLSIQKKPDSNFLSQLLVRFNDVFYDGKHLGVTDKTKHRIKTLNDNPVCQKPYRIPHHQMNEMRQIIDEMLLKGQIRPSESPWSSPAILVPKKDGTQRLCIDFRKLNSVTVKDKYPLPNIQDLLDKFYGAKYFTSLDLAKGYWQVPIEDSDCYKTAFSPGPNFGFYEFVVMPFGLTNAPSTFQRLMDVTLKGLNFCTCCLDDILIFSQSEDEHKMHVEQVLERLRSVNLKIQPSKCKFFSKSVKFLGFVIDDLGVSKDPEYIQGIVNYKTPNNFKELERFLGMCSFYNRFIQNYASISLPLYNLKNKEFNWTKNEEEAFVLVKNGLTNAPTLMCPNFDQTFELDCDASGIGVGAVLSQYSDGLKKPICLISKNLEKGRRSYSTTDRECYALVWAIQKLKHYLLGKKFTILSDHNPLTYLMSMKEVTGMKARWIMKLQEFDFDIKYKSGKENFVADALSRSLGMVEYVETRHLENLQKEDETINGIVRWLSGDETQHNENIVNSQLWGCRENLKVCNGILYYEGNGGLKICLSGKSFDIVLRSYHDNLGHYGYEKVVDMISKYYFYPGMQKRTKEYIKACVICAKNKSKPIQKTTLTQFDKWGIFECWSVDFIGPLPTTGAGNRYILLFVDHFSKWIEAFACENQRAQFACDAFRSIVARFGLPKAVLSDQGTQFESRLWKSLCHEMGITKLRTTAYHPECNGQAERYVRTLKERLRCILCEKNLTSSDWDLILDDALLSIRVFKTKANGKSAYEVCFGKEMIIPNDLAPSISSFVGKLQDHSLSRSTLNSSRDEYLRKMKEYHDRKISEKPLEVGDLVYVRKEPKESIGCLEEKFDGPYPVLQKKGKDVYAVNIKGRIVLINRERLFFHRGEECRESE